MRPVKGLFLLGFVIFAVEDGIGYLAGAKVGHKMPGSNKKSKHLQIGADIELLPVLKVLVLTCLCM